MDFLSKLLITTFLSALAFQTSYAAELTTTPQNVVAAPKQTYSLLYTLNAEHAELDRLSNGTYQITLHRVAPKVIFKNAADKSGMVTLKQFIKKLTNQSAIINVDISGVQSNNKTVGQTTFYSRFTLSKAIVSDNDQTLRFDATALNPGELNVGQTARFDNATVFINGCTLCDCKTESQNCVME